MITLLFAAALAAPAEIDHPDWGDPKVRADTQLHVVEALIDAGQPEKALEVAKDVRAQGRTDARLDVLQARALHATGMHAEARSMLEAHLKKVPRDAAGWSALGVVLADEGDSKGAVAALERAARITPKDPTVLNNLGFARLAAGDAEGAVTAFKRSLEQDPTQARTRNNLGFALARQEKDDEALQAFRAAGTPADAWYNLGVACELRGDRGAALAHYHAALEAQPDHAAAATALSNLLPEPAP